MKYVEELHQQFEERQKEQKTRNTMFTEEDVQHFEKLKDKVDEEEEL